MNLNISLMSETTSDQTNPLLSQLFVWYQPQMFSLFIVILLAFVISLLVFLKIRKAEVTKAPVGVALIAESVVGSFDNFFDEVSEGRVGYTRQYLFSLLIFLVLGNILGLVGLEAIASSYSVPLALTLVTWTGIRIIEVFYQRQVLLRKYANPLNVIGEVSPILSLSIRMFGNITGGSVIVALVYIASGFILSSISNGAVTNVFLLGPIVTPFLHLYFDLFGGFIQSYVFTLLTTLFWSSAASQEELEALIQKKAIKKARRAEKKALKVKKRAVKRLA